MESMNGIYRPIVRAAMDADGFKFLGAFDRVDDEEYGTYIYIQEDDDPKDPEAMIMLANLNEDDGALEIGKCKEFKDHEDSVFIDTILNYNGSNFEEKMRDRYPLPAIADDETGKILDHLHDLRADLFRDLSDRGRIAWPTSEEWDEMLLEWIEDAKENIFD